MSLLLRYSAEYNRMDYLISQRHRHDGNIGEQVTYDSAYRTTEYRDGVSNPAGPAGAGTFIDESWRFDGVSNWTEKTTDENQQGPQTITATANEMNEYTVFAGEAHTHDANGNRLSDDRFTYVWDFANRLREVRDKTSGNLISTMSYHVDARRTRKVDTGSPDVDTRFVWDGNRMIREETPTGAVVGSTVFGRGFELIQRRGSAGNRFIHEDAKGWIGGTSDTGTGALTERYRYSVYGETVLLDGTGAVAGTRAEESPWLYHGYYLDDASEHYYAIHRYHDPSKGRWLSRDPLLIGGEGPYSLTNSSPTTRGDHDGRQPVSWPSREAAAEACRRWVRKEIADIRIRKNPAAAFPGLPNCPCRLGLTLLGEKDQRSFCVRPRILGDAQQRQTWTGLKLADDHHPGATWCMRSAIAHANGSGQQCCYDADGRLITMGPGAGTPDRVAPVDADTTARHFEVDVKPFYACRQANMLREYLRLRPPNQGPPENRCRPNAGGRNLVLRGIRRVSRD